MSTDAPTPTPEAVPAKGSKKKLVLIALVVLMLGGGGGGAYWWFVARPAASTDKPKVVEKPVEKPGILPLDAFVVNLADGGGGRYLRVTLSLLIEGEEHAKELEEEPVAKMKVRSAILELLALQSAEKLTTAEGKAELKKAIAERAAHATEHLKVTDVLFSEFIVQ
jgi:flagellar FliL protein